MLECASLPTGVNDHLAGFAVAALVLSLGTDFVLETTGVLPKGPLHDVRQGLIELA